MRLGVPKLDFIVIGAQKGGTTSMWRYLEDNRMLRMPPAKEAPFFLQPAYPGELRGFMRALFKDAPRRAKLGTVTPDYMVGVPEVPVPEIARRIRMTFPDVRLIALLRDPVERAHSSYRMLVARGRERRTFEAAIAEQLEPGNLRRARAAPDATETYVAAGEYGRMLGAYLERFPREHLHIELSADLAAKPGEVVRRVCSFIGVRPHTPQHLGRRFHSGGRRRVSEAAEADLKEYLDRNVFVKTRYPAQHRHTFDNWFVLWNVEPEPPVESADAVTATRLREHYAPDARLLAELTGFRLPWGQP